MLTPPVVVLIVELPPIMPIAIPIDDEFPKAVQLVPLTPEIKLLAIVRLLVAVPVPTAIPLPPQPPVLVARTFVILFLVIVVETNPVSSEIATGDAPALVSTLNEFWLITLFRLFPTWIPMFALAEFVLMIL